LRFLFFALIFFITPPISSAESIINKSLSNKNTHNYLISFGNSNNERIMKLKYAMKIVGARMGVGISYNDLNNTFLPLIDSLAITVDEFPDESIVIKAQKAMEIFSILKSFWGNRISSTESDGKFVWSADSVLVPSINKFNRVVKLINPGDEGLTIPELKKQYGLMTMNIVDAETIETTIYQYLQSYLSK
tara:strand:+ start:39 stop:608 length:570 start_codon:yes stop_codon:yes gene_type:complete